MAQATFSVQMDETLKKQFDTLCSISSLFRIIIHPKITQNRINSQG